jgi:hypothetical protein
MRSLVPVPRVNRAWYLALISTALVFGSLPAVAVGKSKPDIYGEGLTVSVPVPEPELVQAVEEVTGDGIIQGTKEYNKDEYVEGAEAANSTKVFPPWTGSGHVYYKVKTNALDPWNFKDSSDSGTLAVRYVVEHKDDKNTLLRIDAIFVDDFHLRKHLSNGSVESAEYKDVQDHLDVMALKRKQATDQEQRRQQQLAAQELARKRREEHLQLLIARSPNESLEQHVGRLRREVERVVKAPGAQLRSAPFESASSLQSMPAGAHVAVLILTPYWLGVETEDGQHGWINLSQLEQLP